MKRDRILGILVAGASLGVAVLAGLYAIFNGAILPLTAFAWPALGFIVGLAIIFSGFVEAGLQLEDEIEEFPELIEDDISDLRSGRATPTHIMIAATLLAAVVQIGVLLWFEKIYASWGPFNVLLVALLVVALTLFWSIRAVWFQLREQRLAPHIFWIPAVGWLVCMLIGISYAEPREYGGVSQLERSQATGLVAAQAVSRPRSNYAFWRTADFAGEVIADFDCDDEGCLIMLLVIVVVVAVIASATIPHFWVVSSMLLLTFMGVIALRELLFREGRY
jgi:hypothetical protein